MEKPALGPALELPPVATPQNGQEEAPSPPRIIDLTPLLLDLERQIEEADQEMQALQLKAVRLRGLRDGVLLVVQHAQHPAMTSGEAS